MRPLKQKQLDFLLTTLQDNGEYVFLDTSRCGAENKYSFLFVEPEIRLEFFSGDDPQVFISRMENVLADGKYLAGWMSYEFGYLLESCIAGLLPAEGREGSPLASFGVFQEALKYDHESGESSFPLIDTVKTLSEFTIDNLTASQSKENYLEAIHRIKEYIAAGDTYQVNYTLKLLFDFCGSPEAFYRDLRRSQSVAYGAIMHLGAEHILSLSPELFFRVNGKSISVCPMKGTSRRGRYWQEDQDLCEALKKDIKNRSENVMIVDLLRNDLGRLSHQVNGGAVVTESLFNVERYESVLQMTSRIVTETDGNIFKKSTILDVLKALFPCGSVTGAPKIRTMEIIRELEESPRGVYTGAIGYFSPDGDAAFNVPIRTIRLTDGKGEMGIGSGIVYDSDPEQEWEECLLKADFLTNPVPDFVLIETLLLEPANGYWLLDEHLVRLKESADYFSYLFPDDEIRRLLDDLQKNPNRSKKCYRVRLTLAKDGTLEITLHACDAPSFSHLPDIPSVIHEGLPAIGLSEYSTNSSSPYFFHKTSHRDLFNSEFARAQKEKLFDIVFFNERGELTEGCITNLILFLDGKYYTPPIASGLLSGIMRQQLLFQSSVELCEKTLTMEDLYRAEAVFCCNSVRGVVQVRLTDL